MSNKHVCQVAICAHNAQQLRDWYQQVFGMVKTGKIFSAPPLPTDRIQGVHPNPIEAVSWLIDQQDYFQLEFFQYYRPRSVLKPADWRPCDIGYNVMGIFAADFDKVLSRLAAHSDQPLPAVAGATGDRRLCLQDPEGNWLEILERDPLSLIEGTEPCIVRPELLTATRFMRMSVPNLELTRDAFVNAMGLAEVEGFQLHTPQDEARWGLPGAAARTALLRSRNFLVEIVEYQSHEPRLRPPGYQICDQGYMNIALGYREKYEFDREFGHASRNGMRPNGAPIDIGLFRVMYVDDPQDFSVEMLYARKPLWAFSGFAPGGGYVQNEVLINAPMQAAWNALIDHEGAGDWSIFKGRILRPGRESRNGPGCLRELRAPGVRITEEVVAWDEGRHYTYKLRSGAPFTWHQGDIFLSEENGLTRVRWAIRFESWLPFTSKLTALLLQLVFRRTLGTLKRRLETQESARIAG